MTEPAIPHTLLRLLQEEVQAPVNLVLTNNRSRLISVRKKNGHVEVRLQKLFLEADLDLWQRIAAYVGGGTPDLAPVRAFFDRHPSRPTHAPGQKREIFLNPVGEMYDLTDIFSEVNAAYFEGRVSARITWGPRRKSRTAKRRTLGSFNFNTQTIRVHPLLDSPDVPRDVVAFIVYHEMLHVDMGAPIVNGRRRYHSPEFYRRERLFDSFPMVKQWLRMQGFQTKV